MVFKKDITPMPIGRGDVTKHKGKGAAPLRDRPVQRALNRYPKPAAAPAPAPDMGMGMAGPFKPPGMT